MTKHELALEMLGNLESWIKHSDQAIIHLFAGNDDITDLDALGVVAFLYDLVEQNKSRNANTCKEMIDELLAQGETYTTIAKSIHMTASRVRAVHQHNPNIGFRGGKRMEENLTMLLGEKYAEKR